MVKKLIFLLFLVPTLVFGQSKFSRGVVIGGGTPLNSITLEEGAIVHNAGTAVGKSRLPRGFILNGVYIDRIEYTGGSWVWTVGSSSSRKFNASTGIIIGNGATIDSVYLSEGAVVGAYVGATLYPFFFEEFARGDYFVDATGGNDANTGLSPSQAWATISKVNGETFASGDTISFICGGVWRETLTVPHDSLTFMSYGAGARPKILGSVADSAWTNVSGNIWKTGTYVDPFSGTDGDIWFVNGSVMRGNSVIFNGSFSYFINEYDWAFHGDSIYVYSPADPGTRYTSVEIPQRDNGASLNSKEYLTFDGIDFIYLKSAGIAETQPTAGLAGLIVKNAELSHTGTEDGAGSGVSACYSNMIFQNLTVRDHGRRGLSIYNYGTADISNILVDSCRFYDGLHTTGADIATGTVAGDLGNIDSIIIQKCLFEETVTDADISRPVMISLIGDTENSGGTISKVYIYNNVFKNPGFASIYVEDSVDQAYIYDNTFWGMNQYYTSNIFFIRFGSVDEDCHNWIIKNNIFYNNADYDVNTTAWNLLMDASTFTYTDIDADYNLYWTEDSRLYIVAKTGGNAYNITEFTDLQSNESWETNSPIPSNPLVYSDDFYLRIGSDAIDAGLAIDWIIDDYYGTARGAPPSIGATELITSGDTVQSFIASATISKKDSITITTSGYPVQPDSLILRCDAGNDSIGIGGGTLLYSGHDTTAINDTYFYNTPADTTVRVELWQSYYGVWSYYPNHDTAFVDSLGHAPSTLLDGIIAYWNGEDASSPAVDQVSSADGTCTAITFQQTGKVNYAYQGTSNTTTTIAIGDDPTFDLQVFSVSLWLKVNNYYYDLVGDWVGGQGWRIYMVSGNLARIGFGQSPYPTVTSDGTVGDNAWHHLVCTYDGTNILMYVDNVLQADNNTFSSAVTYTGVSFAIGDAGGNNFVGYIDEIGIWNRVLTGVDGEVTELWNAGNGTTYPF